MHASGKFGIGAIVLLAATFVATPATGQGQDSTPGERSLKIMAELLPGVYDNVNQNYFDTRRNLPDADRHVRMETTITRVTAPAFGDYAYLWINRTRTPKGVQASYRIATLEAGPGADEVTMRHYMRMQGEIRDAELASLRPADLRRTDGCDYVFERRADHFRGQQGPRACRFEWDGEQVYTDNEISLSRSSLWFVDHKYVIRSGKRITGVASGEPFWLERSRVFHCYADMPGVGGGRDIPFVRYDGITLHDKGGTHWFTTREPQPREIGIELRAVTWQLLNEKNGEFNRDSLVLYVLQKSAGGATESVGYAFTEPGAERIGLNLKWILANCSMTPRGAARPSLD